MGRRVRADVMMKVSERCMLVEVEDAFVSLTALWAETKWGM